VGARRAERARIDRVRCRVRAAIEGSECIVKSNHHTRSSAYIHIDTHARHGSSTTIAQCHTYSFRRRLSSEVVINLLRRPSAIADHHHHTMQKKERKPSVEEIKLQSILILLQLLTKIGVTLQCISVAQCYSDR
jgi:hypothetical protein